MKATHYVYDYTPALSTRSYPRLACGRPAGNVLKTTDTKKVNCVRCRQTWAFHTGKQIEKGTH